MKPIIKKILKVLGVGLIAAFVAHESHALYEIKKDNIKMRHRLKKPRVK